MQTQTMELTTKCRLAIISGYALVFCVSVLLAGLATALIWETGASPIVAITGGFAIFMVLSTWLFWATIGSRLSSAVSVQKMAVLLLACSTATPCLLISGAALFGLITV